MQSAIKTETGETRTMIKGMINKSVEKKCILLGVLLFSLPVFAEEERLQLFMGAGCGMPASILRINDNDTQNVGGAFFTGMCMLADSETHFSLKLDFGMGAMRSDFPYESQKEGVFGDAYNVALGAGYTLFQTSHTLLALYAGVTLLSYSFKDPVDMSVLLGGLGGDVQFIKRLGGDVFCYASMGTYYVLGREKQSHDSRATEHFVQGTVAVLPALGLCCSF